MSNQQSSETSRHRASSTRVERNREFMRPNAYTVQGQILQQKMLKERIRESLPAVIIGIVIIICGTALLFWNEGEAVYKARTLDEGFNSVLVMPSPDYVDLNNDGKLIHVWGMISVMTPLQDPYYGIKVRAVSLKRRVQTYQWIEEESTFSSSDDPEATDSSYSYSQLWKDKLVDSSSFYLPFGHENPTSIPVTAVIQTAETVKVGSYDISPAIKEIFTKFIPFSGDEQPDTDQVKLHNGMYYFTKDIFNPDVGDIRVQFYFAGHDGEIVTLIGKQSGSTLHPYVTSSGRELLIVREGKLSVEMMFSSEHAQNRFLTWVYRLFGWFLIFIGMTAISSIIEYLVTLSPLLRDVIFLGLGSANLTLSMSLSLLLIGGAWAFYRPTLALLILGGATLPLLRATFRRSSFCSWISGERNTNPTTGGV